VAHPDKIAVGGHSYGAFMTANLLAHAPHLFCCGIARSGAYNRTLTPFGFQNEDRTLWEATNTYVEMSPFMSANKIKKPILLIHGEQDNNSGTLTMQVKSHVTDLLLCGKTYYLDLQKSCVTFNILPLRSLDFLQFCPQKLFMHVHSLS
jgi:predicted esterase